MRHAFMHQEWVTRISTLLGQSSDFDILTKIWDIQNGNDAPYEWGLQTLNEGFVFYLHPFYFALEGNSSDYDFEAPYDEFQQWLFSSRFNQELTFNSTYIDKKLLFSSQCCYSTLLHLSHMSLEEGCRKKYA